MASILATSEALAARLQTLDAIGDRVWPDVAPDTPVYPLVTYGLGDTERVLAMRVDPDLESTDWTVTVYARGARERILRGEEVAALLHRWSAVGIIQTAFVTGERTGYDPQLDAFTYGVTVRIWAG